VISIGILTLLGLAVAIVAGLAWRRRRAQQVDLGVVSHQWVAEHRLGQVHDRQQ
jgi:hypothetical protein